MSAILSATDLLILERARDEALDAFFVEKNRLEEAGKKYSDAPLRIARYKLDLAERRIKEFHKKHLSANSPNSEKNKKEYRRRILAVEESELRLKTLQNEIADMVANTATANIHLIADIDAAIGREKSRLGARKNSLRSFERKWGINSAPLDSEDNSEWFASSSAEEPKIETKSKKQLPDAFDFINSPEYQADLEKIRTQGAVKINNELTLDSFADLFKDSTS